jgi:hypothetical protein
MRVRSTIAATAALTLSATSLGCAPMCPQATALPAPTASAAPAAAHTSAKPPEARHVYRLDFGLSSGGAFSLTLEEDRGGDVRMGSNVPLQTGASSPRQDVGLNLHCSYVTIGDDLLLHTNFEMSSVDEPASPPAVVQTVAIHKVATAGDVLIASGKPVVVNSIEDPVGHKRYQLTVTATKLR